MIPVNKVGFTIIETMLFLAITGLLVAAIFATTGTSINIQRYHDSVTSLQSYIQQQYSEVANVHNDSASNLCNGVTSDRGQSNCVILGRFITSTDSQNVTSSAVIGYINPATTLQSDDILAINQYNPIVSSNLVDSYQIEWGSTIIQPHSTNPMQFSILIIRSPSSGVIRSFINTQTPTVVPGNILSMINLGSLANSATLCVDSHGLFTGTTMAVFLEKNATNSSSVEMLGDTSGC